MPLPSCPDEDPSAPPPLPPEAVRGRLSIGQAFIHMMDDAPCYRRVGCPSFGLPVLSGDGAFVDIERYEAGHIVRACGRKLDWSSRRVVFSDGLPSMPQHPFGVIVVYQDTAIVVSTDHIFLLPDRMLIRADRLTPADALVRADGRTVPITALHAGDYLAGFYRIATAVEEPNTSLEGHLLNTNGVISGDYAVQVFARARSLDALFHTDHATRPIIGSAAYRALHGDAYLAPPAFDGTHIRVYADACNAI